MCEPEKKNQPTCQAKTDLLTYLNRELINLYPPAELKEMMWDLYIHALSYEGGGVDQKLQMSFAHLYKTFVDTVDMLEEIQASEQISELVTPKA